MAVWVCISSRFGHPVDPCGLCGETLGDRQAHYLSCALARRWMGDRLWLCDLPSEGNAIPALLCAVGASGDGAIKVALALCAIIYVVDARRHAATQHSAAILDARLKEMRRRYAAVRALPLGALVGMR